MLCGIPWQKKKGEDAMSDGVVRRPTHAGSWYTDRGEELEASFRRWMDAARVGEGPVPRAIIGPHAGYSYCGHVGAYCYKALLRAEPKRVFLLGPSHHYFTRRCCLSGATSYDTPVGSMKIDQAVYAELHKTGLFDVMPLDVDEAEHSLELHAPYIRHTFSNRDFLLVPIMVGSLSPDAEAQYGRALAPYLSDPANVFVISSDFCHWGRRFAYTPYDKGQGDICDAIEAMDKRGMDAITTLQPAAFTSYLQETKNTICGRHPIGVLLQMLKSHAESAGVAYRVEWLKYDQSSRCRSMSDSSVSYAAGVVYLA